MLQLIFLNFVYVLRSSHFIYKFAYILKKSIAFRTMHLKKLQKIITKLKYFPKILQKKINLNLKKCIYFMYFILYV